MDSSPSEAPSNGMITGRFTREIITGAIPTPTMTIRDSTARVRRVRAWLGRGRRPRGADRPPRSSPAGRKVATITVAPHAVTAYSTNTPVSWPSASTIAPSNGPATWPIRITPPNMVMPRALMAGGSAVPRYDCRPSIHTWALAAIMVSSPTRVSWWARPAPASSPCEITVNATRLATTSRLPVVTRAGRAPTRERSEEHTSELQSRGHLVCRLLLEKKKNKESSEQYPCNYFYLLSMEYFLH